jgi:hypothetical protein
VINIEKGVAMQQDEKPNLTEEDRAEIESEERRADEGEVEAHQVKTPKPTLPVQPPT